MIKFKVNETCEKCGAEFNPVKDYLETINPIYMLKWWSHLGITCPNCGARHINRFEKPAGIILLIIAAAAIIAALVFGVKI
jgi:DNA-directed RNA polymerase subunit RPC12/RpoP